MFLASKFFLKNNTFNYFHAKHAFKARRVITIKTEQLIIRKNAGTVLCAKFTVDPLSRFRTGAC